jgi:hypothetical protein
MNFAVEIIHKSLNEVCDYHCEESVTQMITSTFDESQADHHYAFKKYRLFFTTPRHVSVSYLTLMPFDLNLTSIKEMNIIRKFQIRIKILDPHGQHPEFMRIENAMESRSKISVRSKSCASLTFALPDAQQTHSVKHAN